MTMYQNAYDVYRTISPDSISESYFYGLITRFQKTYLASIDYTGRLNQHRNPIAFINGVLNNLYEYHKNIQSRPEMRYNDEENKSSGYVPTKVVELWEADKKLKTLYNSVKYYCILGSKDFDPIAIHIAEYRAINKLIVKLRRAASTINQNKVKVSPENNEELIKRFQEVEERRKNARIFCYHCKRETKQISLFEKGELAEPQEIVLFNDKGKRENSVWTIEGRIWKIFQCLGCENINLNVFMRHSPFADDMLIHHFPIRDFRPFPTWVTHLNRVFTELFCEVYLSLNAGNTRLPLMGARTLLDMFIVEKIGDQGSFKNKLQKLVDQKYISELNRELLEVALEYGHATIHRGYQPNKDEINSVLDIIENILYTEALKDKTKDLIAPTRK